MTTTWIVARLTGSARSLGFARWPRALGLVPMGRRLGFVLVLSLSLPSLARAETSVREPARAPDSEPTEGEEPEEADEEGGGEAQQIFGWTALGLGAATVVAGGVLAAVAAGKFSDLDCPNDTCPVERAEEVESYNDLRIPAGLTIGAGLLVMGLGIPFLIYGDEDDHQDARLTPLVGPGYWGLRGRF